MHVFILLVFVAMRQYLCSVNGVKESGLGSRKCIADNFHGSLCDEIIFVSNQIF